MVEDPHNSRIIMMIDFNQVGQILLEVGHLIKCDSNVLRFSIEMSAKPEPAFHRQPPNRPVYERLLGGIYRIKGSPIPHQALEMALCSKDTSLETILVFSRRAGFLPG